MLAKQVLGIIFSNSYDSALPELTALRTMGSVPVAGRYRLIDFPLSGMVNAGISKVGVVTKSNYRSLMDHLGTGKPWDLARKTGGMFLLPPFSSGDSAGIYQTRLEALMGLRDFFRDTGEEYVLLCDSNILCNLDVAALMAQHERTGADITVGLCSGRLPALPQLLRAQADAAGRITACSFASKDDSAEGDYITHIYLLKKALLERLLNEAASERRQDFEEHFLRSRLEKLALYGFRPEGFVRIVDSLQRYYDISMELLQAENRRSLFLAGRPVYTKVRDEVPALYGLAAKVSNSLIADGCSIEGTVENSILFRGAKVAKGAVVRDSVLLQGSYVSENAHINCVITDKNALIHPERTLSGEATFPIYVGKGIAV